MRIVVMTPVYGSLASAYCDGMMQVALWARDNGHELYSVKLPGSNLIDKARNVLLDQAMAFEPDEYVFIDDDVGFDASAFERLLSHDVPFVGGVYPQKVEGEPRFPVRLLSDKNGFLVKNGSLVRVTHLPAGFLRIRKDCLEKMLSQYGESSKTRYRMGDGSQKIVHHLFAQGAAFTDGGDVPAYVGEDVHFCNLWSAIGGEIWADTEIALTHTGQKTWEHEFGDFIRSVESKKEEDQGVASDNQASGD